MNVLEHFGPLDELIQVIYQGPCRFVLISRLDNDSWNVHLGLNDKGGRWWRGQWANDDILALAGSKASEKFLEAFSERLADTIVQGELYVGNWSSENGAEINITFGPTAQKPLSMPLTELTSQEAAAYTASELFSIALQAQSRKCHINTSPFQTVLAESKPLDLLLHKRSPKRRNPSPGPSEISDTKTQDEIKALRAQLAQAKADVQAQAQAHISTKISGIGSKSAPAQQKPHKGASLANPRKKARKIKAMEFASDEE